MLPQNNCKIQSEVQLRETPKNNGVMRKEGIANLMELAREQIVTIHSHKQNFMFQ
jgi:hypothetical protein